MFILVGLVLQLLFTLSFLVSFGNDVVAASVATSGAALPILGLLFLAFGLVGFVLLFLVYTFSYRRTREGEYDEARDPTLIFAVLSMLTVFHILPGFVYLIGWFKLEDAQREQQMPMMAYSGYGYASSPHVAGGPGGFSPGAAPGPPLDYGAPAIPSAPICPTCGRPTTFIAQYQRYFCYADQRYL